jgi:hypothetical protein
MSITGKNFKGRGRGLLYNYLVEADDKHESHHRTVPYWQILKLGTSLDIYRYTRELVTYAEMGEDGGGVFSP